MNKKSKLSEKQLDKIKGGYNGAVEYPSDTKNGKEHDPNTPPSKP